MVLVIPQKYSFSNFRLESGANLPLVDIVYETYGTLSRAKDNVVIVCHALTGSAHAAGYHSPQEKMPGWWDPLIGPGKVLDTNRFFIICLNILGSCYGSTGPASPHPDDGTPYAMRFPVITIRDMVRAHFQVIKHLGIEKIRLVIGGSLGGMQALEWALLYPDMVENLICIAAPARLYPQAIAFNEVGRQAIMSDPEWRQGNYYPGKGPVNGLAIARMLGTITYRSDLSMNLRFGRKSAPLPPNGYYSFDQKFEVETYLHYHGQALVQRFDANSYLYLTKAMDYHDISFNRGKYEEIFADIKAKTLVIGIDTDILFPTYQQQEIVKNMVKYYRPAYYREITSPHGHDAFLIEYKQLGKIINEFIAEVAP
ncbi:MULTISPECIES: homoserine O-acetyltransferase [Carboxydocella]|uniref:Homoserine O-acetyltransferase n=2 Tax=Carboxydocella TaxID=178898 RepID=A0A1T4LSK6_9FIRM|nr:MULTISPECIES: homoserine O-acetyltransferase [Carboxydocella]AVX20597.1 homoserine O-acetyltransferase [Carboxydocella thermautotrophica]AVX31019.1 homoserine O-acetyltransferase [Carboxydocella thermautotrophica]GAW31524.1 homoserine O-acetyltransferase [Carboxydocella sp. JDF658]SJZ57710.1 homoserine O-acetyltransferase [Carboxydocella sporoproducens DSM 16521]